MLIIHIHAEFYHGIWFSFAQKAYRLNVSTKLKHIPTKLQEYQQHLYSTNTAHTNLFPQRYS